MESSLAARVAGVFGQSSPVDPSIWEQFGPFGIVFVLMVFAIGWLLKERSILEQRHQAESAERDARERVLYDRIISQGEHFAPVLEQTNWVLDRATRLLEENPPPSKGQP